MVPVIRVDDEVFTELQQRAVDLGLVFGTPNQVLRGVLGLEGRDKNQPPTEKGETHIMPGNDGTTPKSSTPVELPTSRLPALQGLIDQLLPTVQQLLGKSGSALTVVKSKYWVGYPNNFFALRVQDARKRDLCIEIYGAPEGFSTPGARLQIRPGRPGYSRFNIDHDSQIPDTNQVIRQAYELKQQRRK